MRRVAADGSVQVLGDAAPRAEVAPWVGADGLAWLEADGVRWFAAKGTAAVPVPALGAKVRVLSVSDGTLYGVDGTNVLRAVKASEPTKAQWAVPLGGPPATAPIALKDAVFILVDGGLVAVER